MLLSIFATMQIILLLILTSPLENKQTLSEKEYRAYYEKYGTGFRVGMGAEAIKELLKKAMQAGAEFASKICGVEGAFGYGTPIAGRIIDNRNN